MTTINVTDEWIKTKDNNEIYTKTWQPGGTPIATLVAIHGFGEHITRYDRLFTYFATQGIECYGYDQRGWGETAKKSGQYGNNQGYDTALKDIDHAVLKTKRENIPLILFGHSMGGGLIINYLAREKIYKGVKEVTAAIASAPLVTLSMPVSTIKNVSLRLLVQITPSLTIHAGLQPEGISHDKEEIQKYLDDPLTSDFATLATLRSFLDAGSDILNTKAKLVKTTILYSHGDADPINDYRSTAKAYELTSSKEKELKTWPGLFHELHNETLPQRQEVAEFYVSWIKKHIQAKDE